MSDPSLDPHRAPPVSRLEAAVSALVYGLLRTAFRLLARSLRGRWGGIETLEAIARSGRPLIVAFWHEDLVGAAVLLVRRWRRPVAVMVSRSRDGERLARLTAPLGLVPIRASTSRGAVAGLAAMARWLRAAPGRAAALAPDGPRGPRRQAQAGVAALARLTGAVVVPLAFRASRCVRFGSWDRTRLPLPGSRLELLCGKPIEPHEWPDAPEAAAALLGRRLDALHARLEQAGSEAPLE